MLLRPSRSLSWKIGPNGVKFISSTGSRYAQIEQFKMKLVVIRVKLFSFCVFSQDFPNIWLQDHDRSSKGYNHSTFQRKVPTFELDTTNRVTDLSIQGDELIATWTDKSRTTYPIGLISGFIDQNASSSKVVDKTHRMWMGDELFELKSAENIPTYNDLMNESTRFDVRKQMMKTLLKYGVCWLKETPSEHSATVNAAEAFSVVQAGYSVTSVPRD